MVPRPDMLVRTLGLVTLVLAACSREESKDTAESEPTAVEKPETSAPTATNRARAVATFKAPVYNVPVGPGFSIEPGVGIGPIRFGATQKTIERLMESPCTVKTETSCRYPIQAVDFLLDDGVLTKIHIHGDERPFGDDPEQTYGIFNGALPRGVQLGMYDHYVEKTLGPPKAEKEPKPGRFNTVKIAYYDGMRLEYDKLKNGNVVLGGIVLTPSKPGKK